MRVLIVDDHEVVRKGVRSLLLTRPDLDVCGEAVDGRDAIEKASQLRPDVIVMDVSMPRLNGLEATRAIRGSLPETEVLILSQHDSPELVRQAFTAGARGYVCKSSIARHLLTAVNTVSRHESFVADRHEDRPPEIDLRQVLQHGAELEQALRESEERFRSTFESAAVGMAHVDLQGRWIRVNRKFCEIVGYTSDELLKLNVQGLSHPDDLARERPKHEEVLAGRSDHYSIERRYRHRNGSWVWANRTVSAVRDAKGRVKYFIAVVEDITGRKEAEAARGRLAAIVESSYDAIISKDLNGTITSWNDGAHRLFGYTAEEAIGQPILIIIPPELHDEETHILQRLRSGLRIDHLETLRVAKNGNVLNLSLSISPIKDSEGRVTGVSKIARDITERKQTEEALRENQELLRAAFAQTYSFLALLTVDGTVLEANRAALDGTGFTRGEVIGQKIWEPWWGSLPEEQERLKASLATAAKGLAVREECSYSLRDGSIRVVDRTLNPIQNERGEIIMIVASGLDITEQKLLRDTLEQHVRQRTTELEHKNTELQKQTDIVRELSARLLQIQDDERRRIARELHDSVGQMLAAVSMNSSQLSSESDRLSPAAAKTLAESVSLVRQISAEIRTISHLLHPPLLDEVGLESALRWYVDGFRERSKIQVDLDLPQDFGRLSRDQEITLFRVVQESLTNIHRHSGSPTALIRVSRSPDGVSLEVRDQGKGISPEIQATLSSGRISGVGLRGMRERLHQMGGQMELQSNQNGTVVVARLPIAATLKEPPPPGFRVSPT